MGALTQGQWAFGDVDGNGFNSVYFYVGSSSGENPAGGAPTVYHNGELISHTSSLFTTDTYKSELTQKILDATSTFDFTIYGAALSKSTYIQGLVMLELVVKELNTNKSGFVRIPIIMDRGAGTSTTASFGTPQVLADEISIGAIGTENLAVSVVEVAPMGTTVTLRLTNNGTNGLKVKGGGLL